MAVEYPIRASKLGYLRQVKTSNHWGTLAAISAAFAGINANADSVKYTSGALADEFNFNSVNSIMSDEGRRYTYPNASLPSLSYNLVLPKTLTAAHLIAAFQKVSESVGTPYAKTIAPANAFVDFANNGGYLWTLAYSPSGLAVADGVVLGNALIDSLEISIDNLANGVKQLMSANVKWVGSSMSFKNNLSGSWIAPPTNTATFFNTNALPFTLSLTVGSEYNTTVIFRKFTMKYNNNVSIFSRTPAGVAQYALKPTFEFVIDIPFNTSTKGIMNSFGAGDNVDLIFQNSGDSGDGVLSMVVTKGVLTADPLVVNAEYNALQLTVRADAPTAGYTSSMLSYTDTITGGY